MYTNQTVPPHSDQNWKYFTFCVTAFLTKPASDQRANIKQETQVYKRIFHDISSLKLHFTSFSQLFKIMFVI